MPVPDTCVVRLAQASGKSRGGSDRRDEFSLVRNTEEAHDWVEVTAVLGSVPRLDSQPVTSTERHPGTRSHNKQERQQIVSGGDGAVGALV